MSSELYNQIYYYIILFCVLYCDMADQAINKANAAIASYYALKECPDVSAFRGSSVKLSMLWQWCLNIVPVILAD